MEVRSSNEKCGNDAVAVTTTTTTTMIEHSKSLDTIASRNSKNMDSSATALKNHSSTLTKDESEFFS